MICKEVQMTPGAEEARTEEGRTEGIKVGGEKKGELICSTKQFHKRHTQV